MIWTMWGQGASDWVQTTSGTYGATDAWDFTLDQYLRAGVIGPSGLTVTRASDGYAETAAGVLVSFASGVARRTDKGLLVEGARTNLLLRSQEFDDAYWTKVRSSITANAIAAPDGTLTAEKLVEDTTATNSHDVRRNVSVTNGTVYTISVFAKAAERTWCAIYAGFSSAGSTTSFDLANGVIGTVSANATATITALVNGWYRCSITVTANASSGNLFFYAANGDGVAGTSYTGDGVSGVYLWGAQLEAASFASSYIPTVASTVTRAADEVSATTPSTGGPLSLYAEAGPKAIPTLTTNFYEFGDGTTNNVIGLYKSVGTTDILTFALNSGSLTANTASGTYTTAIQKAASRYATNDILTALDGVLGTADTSCAIPSGLITLLFADGFAADNFLFGYLRRAAIIPTALTDAQLQAITT